jgi:hypothetical protein
VEQAARIVLLAHGATGTCSALTAADIEELERFIGQTRQPREAAPD